MGGDVLCPARVAVAQKACTPRSSPNPVLGRHASIACEVQLSKVGLRKSIPSYRENRRALGLLGGETFRESADIFPIDAQGPSVSAWPCRALRPSSHSPGRPSCCGSVGVSPMTPSFRPHVPSITNPADATSSASAALPPHSPQMISGARAPSPAPASLALPSLQAAVPVT